MSAGVGVWEVQTFFPDGSGFISRDFQTAPRCWPSQDSARAVAELWRGCWPDELAGRPLRVAVRPAGQSCACLVVALLPPLRA